MTTPETHKRPPGRPKTFQGNACAIRLPEPHRRALRAIAAARGRLQTEVIRELIQREAERYGIKVE